MIHVASRYNSKATFVELQLLMLFRFVFTIIVLYHPLHGRSIMPILSLFIGVSLRLVYPTDVGILKRKRARNRSRGPIEFVQMTSGIIGSNGRHRGSLEL